MHTVYIPAREGFLGHEDGSITFDPETGAGTITYGYENNARVIELLPYGKNCDDCGMP